MVRRAPATLGPWSRRAEVPRENRSIEKTGINTVEAKAAASAGSGWGGEKGAVLPCTICGNRLHPVACFTPKLYLVVFIEFQERVLGQLSTHLSLPTPSGQEDLKLSSTPVIVSLLAFVWDGPRVRNRMGIVFFQVGLLATCYSFLLAASSCCFSTPPLTRDTSRNSVPPACHHCRGSFWIGT